MTSVINDLDFQKKKKREAKRKFSFRRENCLYFLKSGLIVPEDALGYQKMVHHQHPPLLDEKHFAFFANKFALERMNYAPHFTLFDHRSKH